jgi:hypothetical protein
MSPLQHARVRQAVVLTSILLALLVVIDLALGPALMGLALVTMPVPLILLWLSADVVRSDELDDASTAAGRR